jgi:hypothetical protein
MADRLKVTELDFDTIKQNLKLFLNQQTDFTDYDFEGSGLSVLLDILAYNTHYNAYYLNMVANEAFLDTAQLRDSVVSHAKALGYTPHSMTAPVAIINMEVSSTSNNQTTLTMPKGYAFLSNQIDGKAYNFVVMNDATVTKSNTKFYFDNLEIYEGQLINYNFTHNQASNPKQVFTLPDENIDTTTITVSVMPSISNTSTSLYTKVTDILDVTSTSEAYFLQENKSGKYQIYFGDDVVGKKLPDGAIVTAQYLVTNGTAANKANNFIGRLPLVDISAESMTNFTITPVSPASGGSDRETVDEIKYGSVAQFTSQNRLVTLRDYESYIKKNYPSIDSISVWGGEDEIPKVFGKVFLSLKPKLNYYISEAEKQRIIDEIVTPKSIVSITTEIRDTEYLYLQLESIVKYEKNKTILQPDALKNLVKNSILTYRNANLNKFNAALLISRLQDAIDNSDTSILGNDLTLKIQKRFKPTLGLNAVYSIKFNNAIHRGTTLLNKLTSTEFQVRDSSDVLRDVVLEEVPQSFTGISEIRVTNPGSGYISQPIVTITGDGSGAEAQAVVVNGKIESITIIKRGVDYTKAVITITGGDGIDATAVAVVDSKFGTLRTIYFDSNAERKIVNDNAGTIDYVNGLVTISDINIRSVTSSDGFIRLTTESESGLIESVRNTILTIDDVDAASIVITLDPV